MRFSRIVAFASLLTVCLSAAPFSIDRIDPPEWWTGMASRSLQLQVHGDDIRSANVSVEYPGVTVDSVVRLDGSPDWLYVYLDISPDAVPGNIPLKFLFGKKTLRRSFPLLRRDPDRKGAQGFSSADLLYLVMPDRFSDGNSENNNVASLRFPVGADRTDPNTRHGGDLKGILDHIDYLDSLGVTAVWFTPVLENDMPGGSYHGYATTDYYRIDPRLGTNTLYAVLVDSLHSRGIKTVMDMIFNHCGSEHPWHLDPPASDWFNMQDDWQQTNYRLSTLTDPYASGYDRRLTTDGWFVREMPDLNQRQPQLMDYLIQNSIWWVEKAGIDAVRMDTYPYADWRAMNRWIRALKTQYPDFTIVGECWLPDTGAEAVWQKGAHSGATAGIDSELPVVMDFGMVLKNRDMKPFRDQTDAWNGLNTLYDHLALDFLYPDPMRVLRFLDNHDTERFVVSDPPSPEAWRQAMAFLLTVPGIPQIYYGTEILMSGTREGGDGNIRKDMPGGFPGDSSSVFSGKHLSAECSDALAYLSTVARWRRTSDAVAHGSMKHFLPDNGVYLYERRSSYDQVIVILNGRDEEVTVPLGRYAEVLVPGAVWRDVVTSATLSLEPSEELHLSPRQSMILQRAK